MLRRRGHGHGRKGKASAAAAAGRGVGSGARCAGRPRWGLRGTACRGARWQWRLFRNYPQRTDAELPAPLQGVLQHRRRLPASYCIQRRVPEPWIARRGSKPPHRTCHRTHVHWYIRRRRAVAEPATSHYSPHVLPPRPQVALKACRVHELLLRGSPFGHLCLDSGENFRCESTRLQYLGSTRGVRVDRVPDMVQGARHFAGECLASYGVHRRHAEKVREITKEGSH
jgi:hypothetical protein